MKSIIVILFVISRYLLHVSGLTESDLQHECLRTCEWPPQPKTCVYNFNVVWFYSMSVACQNCPINMTHCHNEFCIPLNGVSRPVAVVNMHLPGPSIQVCENDTIIVHVYNDLENYESLTIHWHGIHQKGTPYMDGVPMVTQCPIMTSTTFTYSFQAYPRGTHWWHSHSGLQQADGVVGSLIVRQAPLADISNALYDYDFPEHVIVVQDWSDQMFLALYFNGAYGSDTLEPKSVLINGKGRRHGFENLAGETIFTERERYILEVGKRYRFRIISNSVVICPLSITVDSHKLTVIASDGNPLKPYEADVIVIQSGERFDFVLEANQNIGNYWMRVQTMNYSDCSGSELALVSYMGAPDDKPPEEELLHDRDVIIVNPVDAAASKTEIPIIEMESAEPSHGTEEPADVIYYLGINSQKFTKYFVTEPENPTNRKFSLQINHRTFRTNSRPPLTQFSEIPFEEFCQEVLPLNMTSDQCKDTYCECTHIISVDLGQVVELVLVAEKVGAEFAHPMHLHGHSFAVVAQDNLGTFTTAEGVFRLDQAGKIKRKLKNPVQKDTVTVQGGGYTVIRFNANNPGWWMLHCHVQFHSQRGMAMIIRVGTDEDLPPKPVNFPQCGPWP